MRHIGVGRRLGALLPALLVAGCAGNRMVMDLRGSVLYEKPQIRQVTHAVEEPSLDEETVVVEVTLLGDPGLDATFDVSPGIAVRQPMSEVEEGRYEGKLSFARDVFGGPYWVTGRLRHDRAGEHVLRDPTPIMISLSGR